MKVVSVNTVQLNIIVFDNGSRVECEIAKQAPLNRTFSSAMHGFHLLSKIVGNQNARSDLGYIVMQGIRNTAMLESLSFANWTATELKELEQLIEPSWDVGHKIYDAGMIYRSELARQIKKPYATSRLPSVRLAVLEHANELLEQCRNPNLSWTCRKIAAERADLAYPHRESSPLAQTWNPHNFWNSTVPYIIDSENTRRLAVTALAVKRFHMAKGTWPDKLFDLQSIGLDESDYTTVDGNLFGFEIGGLKKEEFEMLETSNSIDNHPIYAWLWLPHYEDYASEQLPLSTRPLLTDDSVSPNQSYRIR